MKLLGVILVGLAMACTACQAPGSSGSSPPPSATAAQLNHSVTATGSAGQIRTLGIIDRAGLLAMVPEALAPPEDRSEYTVERLPGNPRVVEYGWVGGCPRDPVLTIEQTGNELLFDLFPGYALATCPAMGESFRIRLTFKASTEGSNLVTHLQDLVIESQQPE